MPSRTKTIGFCSNAAQFFETNREELLAKGLNSANWGTQIREKRDNATAVSAEIDVLQAQLKVKNIEADEAYADAYDTPSSMLDAAIGVLGKKSPLAKEAARIRSSVNRRVKKDEPKK
ncbi:MAG: hypothetical protein LUM44_15015 [Pyrinomonadaceae bacterium]|nr:hypothetical protein [Pyrinomonadaceae bacterium]